MLIILAIGLSLTAAVLLKVGRAGKLHASNLGCMSEQWVAEYNSSRQTSSQ